MLYYSMGKYTLAFIAVQCPYIDIARDILVKQALDKKSDYIMFLDDDQTYPPNTPEILMKHIDDGKLIVGGVTPIRCSGKPMIWDYKEELGKPVAMWDTAEGMTDVKKASGMGMGGVMIDLSVFQTLSPPYFKISGDSREYMRYGEDIIFYLKCKDVGIDVWCDTNLRYGHLDIREIRTE